MNQVFLSPLYLISFVFSSQLARATAYTLSKAKNIQLHNFYFLNKKFFFLFFTIQNEYLKIVNIKIF